MLTVNEVFHSIQGESSRAGERCVFVRLTACDLRCSWCDTPYAFHEGRKMSVDEVVGIVEGYGCPVVELTGGEPLLQADAYELMDRLLGLGKTVMIETGGHVSLARVPRAVVKVMDVKCPGSGEASRMHWPNIGLLAPHDEVKFVVKDRADYEYARAVVHERGLAGHVAAIHFSPVHGVLPARQLAEWVLEDRLPVRVQLQVHKYIWEPDRRGV